MYKYKKNGGLDKRTKEGKQAQKIENFFTFCKSGLGRFIIGLIALAILLEILREKYPAFGAWLTKIEECLNI